MSRDEVFTTLILAALLLGPAWTRFAGPKLDDEGGDDGCVEFSVKLTVLIAMLLHALLQFLPWLAYGVGWVDPEAGLPWECHLAYAVALVLAAPFLSLYFDKEVRDFSESGVPVLSQCLGLEPGGGDPVLGKRDRSPGLHRGELFLADIVGQTAAVFANTTTERYEIKLS